ncbi:hypothetical protein CCMA1212_006463 [Trichoderma ghanense]|uniref:Uncharacterized protein n=1 Tax=Trichoderma ghanense TaxID=65468 RepID=A0ABY2GZT0_9HYPO
MLVQPSIEAEHIVLENDDGVAVGNHAFDNPRREDLITVHGCDEEGSSEQSRQAPSEEYRLLRRMDDIVDEEDAIVFVEAVVNA